ncbi:DNA polymerase I, partial [Patescibacteria group bacterium]
AKLAGQPLFAFDTETTGLNPIRDDLVGMSFSWKAGEGYYLACGKTVPAAIKKIMEDERVKKTGHHLKFDLEVMHRAGVVVQGVAFDTMIASYLLNSGSRGHGLDNLAFIELGHQMQPIEELIGKGKQQISIADVPVEDVSWYAAEDADFSWRLYEKFAPRIKKEGLQKLFDKIEMPTVLALATLEEAGVKLDVEFLNKMSKDLHRRINTLEKKIHDAAGTEFNVASSVQLKEILYEKLQLPTKNIKKTKTGYSTAASELEKLHGEHPIIEMIEEIRELSKLTSTYADALPQLVNPKTGRIHTSFNQTITATGRLSSSDPNLQNIPIRTELGKEIRKAFIPERGNTILSLDYSQVELRIVSHLADDKVMKEAFMRGEDIHARTAAELNDVELDEVTPGMRRQAKAINFGVIYGMGVQGMMRDSGLSREEAQEYLDKYFTVHAGIRKYLDEMKAFAHDHGYAENIFGRRRPLPEIKSNTRMIQAAAERAAINMPVQGAAADIMKMAMIAVQQAIDAGKIDALMLLQVHDELVFEVKKSSAAAEAKKIQKIMEGIYDLGVPLLVDVEAGPNWGDLKPL